MLFAVCPAGGVAAQANLVFSLLSFVISPADGAQIQRISHSVAVANFFAVDLNFDNTSSAGNLTWWPPDRKLRASVRLQRSHLGFMPDAARKVSRPKAPEVSSRAIRQMYSGLLI